jgi:WD40 repeat protein
MMRLALTFVLTAIGSFARPVLAQAAAIQQTASAAYKEAKTSPAEYDKWIRPYVEKSVSGRFPGSSPNKTDQVPLKVIVTAIEGDESGANEQGSIVSREEHVNRWVQGLMMPNQLTAREGSHEQQIVYGCRVAEDGRVVYFQHSWRGSKGGDSGAISDADRKRLDELLSTLPDDGRQVPPPGRRLVLQVPEGDHCRAQVYDRANAPDRVLEILRLSLSGIRSWAPEFKSESDLPVGPDQNNGILALTSNGQLVSAVMNGQLQFFDPTTRQKLKELPLPVEIVPQAIKFSPDGSLAVLTGWGPSSCCVIDATTWKVVRDFREPSIGGHRAVLRFPQFTADGRTLSFLCSQPDAEGHTTVSPRVYDVKTWERRDSLPGLLENALTCIESPSGKRAVILLKGDVVALRGVEQPRNYTKLDEHVQIREVAFSHDERMVAMATVHEDDGNFARLLPIRIRIWKVDTGEMVHELRPFEAQTCEKVVGLQWTADDQYVLAATKAHYFFTNCDINVWNVESGRQRGNLIAGVSNPMGFVVLPDGRHVVEGGVEGGSLIRFWDLASATKQIRSFEASIATVADVK